MESSTPLAPVRCRGFGRRASVLDVILKFLKLRAHVARDGAPAKLHRHAWRRSFNESDNYDADHVIRRVLFIRGLGHVGGNGPHESVAHNPRKVPTCAAATLCPISSGGPPSAPMVITTPSTAATIPSPGKESAIVESALTGSPAS